MDLSRGDTVTIALSGDYGKPRPAVIVQDDAFQALFSLVVLRLTTDLHDAPLFRIPVEPDAANGLRSRSQVMVDKPVAVPRSKIGRHIGHLDATLMTAVDMALARFLSLDWTRYVD